MPRMIGSFRFGRDIGNGPTKPHRRGAKGEGRGEFSRTGHDARIVVPPPWVDSIDMDPPERYVRSFIPASPKPLSAPFREERIQIESLAVVLNGKFYLAFFFLQAQIYDLGFAVFDRYCSGLPA